MKTFVLALVIALCLSIVPVSAIEMKGKTIKLTDAEMKLCADGDGCIVVPRAALREAIDIVKANALLGCGDRT